MLLELPGVNQVVLTRGTSDHFPISLSMDGIKRGPVPFRLDNKWLCLEGFKNLVSDIWTNTFNEGTISFRIASKLRILKEEIKKWVKDAGIKEEW